MRTIVNMEEHPIDLRSDTVTKPTDGMRDAMMAAPLGDDVWGDDPTVNALQERCAEMFGKEDACFVPTGTMANQASIKSQTRPGDEIIIHGESHVVRYEAGGAAALNGCSFAIANGERGFFTADDVTALIKPEDSHFCKTTLLSLENTHNRGGGSIWPLEQLQEVCDRARSHGLRTHLDGARIWHAVVASGVGAKVWGNSFDTISACFSKGLGCPAGSVVVGDRKVIHRVKRARKLLGGTMRQSGILAGAAMYALDHHVERLAEDHANANILAEGLNTIDGITCNVDETDTNLVFFNIDPSLGDGESLCRKLTDRGVLSEALDKYRVRFVTHLDVTKAQVKEAVRITKELCQHAPSI